MIIKYIQLYLGFSTCIVLSGTSQVITFLYEKNTHTIDLSHIADLKFSNIIHNTKIAFS